jgi:glycolate oxidase FAD binding subunit
MTDSHNTDHSQHIVAAIAEARSAQQPLYISAGGSKRECIGRSCNAQVLDVSNHTGIIDYQPAELTITARASTPLPILIDCLEQQGQMLSFEPPLFGGKATIGGTLASNISGPARPWSGSVRDMVLGVQLINGKAEVLNFGGKVMKNVAGYDVSRLQAGALGTLGVLSEISLKVLPKHEHSLTLCYGMSAEEAVKIMNQRAGDPKPLYGACWLNGRLYLRLSGAADALQHTARQWGGDLIENHDTFWSNLREMTLPFFAGNAPLWRLSLKSTAPVTSAPQHTLIDWCGAQRWVRGDYELSVMQAMAETGGGHCTLFSGGDRSNEVRSPLNTVEQRLQQRLKYSFDPDGILNPGRLYSWL